MPALLAAFPGPRYGVAGLRELAGAHGRALTCTALKPQGLAPAALAGLAHRFALAGIDVIKDDHGISTLCSSAIERARASIAAAAARTRYVTSRRGASPTLTRA